MSASRIQNPNYRLRPPLFDTSKRPQLLPQLLFCHFATPESEVVNSTFFGTPAAKNGLVSQDLEPAWCDRIAVFWNVESSSASALQYSKMTTTNRTVVAHLLTYSLTHLLTYSLTQLLNYSTTHLLLMKSNISKPFARNLLHGNA
jgi:hypothetical protein